MINRSIDMTNTNI